MDATMDCIKKKCNIKNEIKCQKRLSSQYTKKSKHWKKTFAKCGAISRKNTQCRLEHCEKHATPLIRDTWKKTLDTAADENTKMKNFVDSMKVVDRLKSTKKCENNRCNKTMKQIARLTKQFRSPKSLTKKHRAALNKKLTTLRKGHEECMKSAKCTMLLER